MTRTKCPKNTKAYDEKKNSMGMKVIAYSVCTMMLERFLKVIQWST